MLPICEQFVCIGVYGAEAAAALTAAKEWTSTGFREEFEFDLESTTEVQWVQPEVIPHMIIEEGAADSTPTSRRKRCQKLLEEGENTSAG